MLGILHLSCKFEKIYVVLYVNTTLDGNVLLIAMDFFDVHLVDNNAGVFYHVQRILSRSLPFVSFHAQLEAVVKCL